MDIESVTSKDKQLFFGKIKTGQDSIGDYVYRVRQTTKKVVYVLGHDSRNCRDQYFVWFPYDVEAIIKHARDRKALADKTDNPLIIGNIAVIRDVVNGEYGDNDVFYLNENQYNNLVG